MTDRRTILIAGMGTSPAVLTETVWALCRCAKTSLMDSFAALATVRKSLMNLMLGKGL